MKIGDISRRWRLSDPARIAYYAHPRAVRFARRIATGRSLNVPDGRDASSPAPVDLGFFGRARSACPQDRQRPLPPRRHMINVHGS
jgi:hypothetical protein